MDARAALTLISAEQDAGYADWLTHNELELAYDVLLDAADEHAASQECWEALLRAALEMQFGDSAVARLRVHL